MSPSCQTRRWGTKHPPLASTCDEAATADVSTQCDGANEPIDRSGKQGSSSSPEVVSARTKTPNQFYDQRKAEVGLQHLISIIGVRIKISALSKTASVHYFTSSATPMSPV
ncbi:hypothetical protein GQ600_24790 [Phytophthora cactorum]|nr:hypothetical protein GQ600_24790 [Phytophthora cactorum]